MSMNKSSNLINKYAFNIFTLHYLLFSEHQVHHRNTSEAHDRNSEKRS